MGLVEVLWDGDGVPLPPPGCEQTENITFRHPSDAGGNKTTGIILMHVPDFEF